jgi:hypothetical protein
MATSLHNSQQLRFLHEHAPFSCMYSRLHFLHEHAPFSCMYSRLHFLHAHAHFSCMYSRLHFLHAHAPFSCMYSSASRSCLVTSIQSRSLSGFPILRKCSSNDPSGHNSITIHSTMLVPSSLPLLDVTRPNIDSVNALALGLAAPSSAVPSLSPVVSWCVCVCVYVCV